MRTWLTFLLTVCSFAALAQGSEPESCTADARYSMLDFWLGDWDVYAGNELVGTNRIEKTLDGCAVLEQWRGAIGRRGMSLFYVDDAGTWKQVWVSESATRPGGVKEKTGQRVPDTGQLRFQGRIRTDDMHSYLDRTTLTALEVDEVRQLIEVSTDEGATWKTVFDATYRRKDES